MTIKPQSHIIKKSFVYGSTNLFTIYRYPVLAVSLT